MSSFTLAFPRFSPSLNLFLSIFLSYESDLCDIEIQNSFFLPPLLPFHPPFHSPLSLAFGICICALFFLSLLFSVHPRISLLSHTRTSRTPPHPPPHRDRASARTLDSGLVWCYSYAASRASFPSCRPRSSLRTRTYTLPKHLHRRRQRPRPSKALHVKLPSAFRSSRNLTFCNPNLPTHI